MADGGAQSPVDLRPELVKRDKQLNEKSWKFDYQPQDFALLKNTGYTWNVEPTDPANSKSTVTADHLPGEYRFAQLHAHWGTDKHGGSEHRIIGDGYAGELHFVHWKTAYGSFNEALQHDDGLAVVGVFLKEHETETNSEMRHIADSLQQVKQKGQTKQLERPVDPSKLIPEKRSFFTYGGSLTTPPYTECVVWSVFAQPLHVAPETFELLRAFLPRNDRDTQALNSRPVTASFNFSHGLTGGSKCCLL